MSCNIIGHKAVLDFFSKVIAAGNLSHAYCFVGPTQVGKLAVAEDLSARLLNTTPERLKMNQDYFFVTRLVDEKTGKKKKDIIIDQMRSLCDHLKNKASGYKIAVIDKADAMNIEAANALLKTLEEPLGKTVLFLLTRDEVRLPSTIRSRCQMIYLSPVKSELIEKYLIEDAGLSKEEAEKIAHLSYGLPGRVKKWLEDNEEYEWYKDEVKRFQSLVGQPFFNKLKILEDLFSKQVDQIASQDKWQKILNIWQMQVRDMCMHCAGMDDKVVHQTITYKKFEMDELKQAEQRILQAREGLRQNIHPQLLIEHILLQIP